MGLAAERSAGLPGAEGEEVLEAVLQAAAMLVRVEGEKNREGENPSRHLFYSS